MVNRKPPREEVFVLIKMSNGHSRASIKPCCKSEELWRVSKEHLHISKEPSYMSKEPYSNLERALTYDELPLLYNATVRCKALQISKEPSYMSKEPCSNRKRALTCDALPLFYNATLRCNALHRCHNTQPFHMSKEP